mmetsp:Transcript_65175/g.172679  ORF Transcript_65175/g.172679 Transcript_65175/m.172679 type:complete len:92 (+) Transcript_65175:437-712(+)
MSAAFKYTWNPPTLCEPLTCNHSRYMQDVRPVVPKPGKEVVWQVTSIAHLRCLINRRHPPQHENKPVVQDQHVHTEKPPRKYRFEQQRHHA